MRPNVNGNRAVGSIDLGRHVNSVPQHCHAGIRLSLEHVDRSQEFGHKCGVRLLVEDLRRPHLLDPAAVEHDHLVGDLESLLLVVGYEQARDMDFVVKSTQPGSQLVANLGVERTEWLIQQQYLGPRRKRRASATRCRWPPESCEGYRSA